MNTSREARKRKIYLKGADHEPATEPRIEPANELQSSSRPRTAREKALNHHNYDYYNNFNDSLQNYYRKNLITKIEDRQNKTLEVSKSLDKFKSKNLEKLRTRMENQINFIDTRTDYGIKKVNENFLKREKIISNNLDKFVNNERPEKIKLMDSYIR
jgi:hypothetical protein